MKLALTVILLIVSLVFPTGRSWSAEFFAWDTASLKQALSDAHDNGQDDVIKVLRGTYYGNFYFSSYEGKNITLHGGYGFSYNRRHPTKTVLDGGHDGIVLELHNEGGGWIYIDGFIFQNGLGGVYAVCSSTMASEGQAGGMIISNNVFRENQSQGSGGGLYANSHSPAGIASAIIISQNSFVDNHAEDSGGGVCVWAYSQIADTTPGPVFISGNLVTGNSTGGSGGGIWAGSHSAHGPSGSLIVAGNTISQNVAEGAKPPWSRGGGAYVHTYSLDGRSGDLSVRDNTVSGNYVNHSGGGLAILTSTVSGQAGMVNLSKNNVFENYAVEFVGGVNARSECSSDDGTAGDVVLTNNMITRNGSGGWYGGVSVSSTQETPETEGGTGGDLTVTNNTIVENYADDCAGGLHIWSGANASNIYNNIIWGNTATTGGDIFFLPCVVNVNGFNNDYSDIYGTWSSEANNIDQDPLFKGPNSYHLQYSSPCRDAGTAVAPLLPATDYDGEPRFLGSAPDIGADEYMLHLIAHPPFFHMLR